jgi:RNA polymerase sigma-70 factor (ECF subfamily)
MILLLTYITDPEKRNRLETLYNLYHRDMYITAYAILKDHHDAEDVVQSAIIKLTRNLDKISDLYCNKSRAYIVITVRHLSLDTIKHKKKTIHLTPDQEVDEISGAIELDGLDAYLLKLELGKTLATALDALHRPYADILTLKYYHQLSASEISDVLGMTSNHVNVTLHRALKAIKKILEKMETETVGE